VKVAYNNKSLSKISKVLFFSYLYLKHSKELGEPAQAKNLNSFKGRISEH
jgi:hypothetical protein